MENRGGGFFFFFLFFFGEESRKANVADKPFKRRKFAAQRRKSKMEQEKKQISRIQNTIESHLVPETEQPLWAVTNGQSQINRVCVKCLPRDQMRLGGGGLEN